MPAATRFPLRLRRLDDHGTAAVEFALVVPLMMLVAVAFSDFGLAFGEKMQAEEAARAGLQYALYDPQDTAGITAAARDATDLPVQDLTITITRFFECANGTRPTTATRCAAGDWPGSYVRIDVTKDFGSLLGFGPLEEVLTVRGGAEGRVQ